MAKKEIIKLTYSLMFASASAFVCFNMFFNSTTYIETIFKPMTFTGGPIDTDSPEKYMWEVDNLADKGGLYNISYDAGNICLKSGRCVDVENMARLPDNNAKMLLSLIEVQKKIIWRELMYYWSPLIVLMLSKLFYRFT